MRGSAARAFVAATVLASSAWQPAGSQPAFPARAGAYVNDPAGKLGVRESASLDARLRDYDARTSNQIVVAIFPSLGGADLEETANRLYREWGIGTREKSNGALLVVFVEDRKARIEVGYGLEDRLTDLISGRILQQRLFPRLREGDWNGGITAACEGILEAVEGRLPPAAPPPVRRRRSTPVPVGVAILAAVVALIVLPRVLGAATTYDRRGRRRIVRGPWWPGGGIGGGGFGGGGGFSGGGGSSGGGGASGSW